MQHLPMMIAALFLLLAAGCGKGEVELAEVTGTVTQDGEPLPRALVRFIPQGDIGRPSTGVTEYDGSYRLLYSARDAGALIGEHRVEITTGDPEQPALYPETVPAEFNIESTLVRTVEADNNVFNFEVTSIPET